MGIHTARTALLALALIGCTPRELAWLVPRASAGFALRTHEGQVAGAGFVTLTTATERVPRLPRTARGSRRLRPFAGPPAPCRVPAACRWEARTRADTLADLIRETSLPEVGAP
jgi:hypothetical protein